MTDMVAVLAAAVEVQRRHELPPLLELRETPEAMGRLEQMAADVTRRLSGQ